MRLLTPSILNSDSQKLAGKLLVHVRYDLSRASVNFLDFPKEGVGNVFCGGIFVEADNVDHFCEPVSNYHYLGLSLRFW